MNYRDLVKIILEQYNKDFPSISNPPQNINHFEIWKDIDNYSGIYKISNYGKIVKINKGKSFMIKTKPTKYGFSVILLKNDIPTKYLLADLVYKHFVRPNLSFIDGDITNNNVNNLTPINEKELNLTIISNIVYSLSKVIIKEVLSKSCLKIKGLGKFRLSHIKERIRYNPHALEHVKVPAYNTIRFDLSDKIKEEINE